MEVVGLGLGGGRKALVGKACLNRVGRRVLDERTARRQRADAAAQLSSRRRGDEGRPPRRKRWRTAVEAKRRRLGAAPRRRPQGGHAGGKQEGAGGPRGPARGRGVKTEGAAAGDPADRVRGARRRRPEADAAPSGP